VQKRIRILAIVMVGLFLVVLLQALNIQFFKSSQLANSSGNPRIANALRNEPRGEILAADGTVLAFSVPSNSSSFRYQRKYPLGTLFSQEVGFNSQVYGAYGLEASYNSYLTVHPQPARSLAQLLSPAKEPDSLTLTLIPSLQKLAATELAGRDGAVVMINPNTGGIMVMYSNPTYDPNGLVAPSVAGQQAAWKAAIKKDSNGYPPLSSMAYQEAFPPGSTFKVVTSATVFDLKPSLATKNYPVTSTISLPDTNKTLSNFGGGSCGGTIETMLPPSCDTGFAEVGLDLGPTLLWQKATAFGFDNYIPVDLPHGSVAISNFPTPAQELNRKPFVAYSAIGQGDVRVTALQNALVAAAIANKGTMMTPHFLRAIRNSTGQMIKTYQPKVWKQTTKASTAASVSQMMQNVVLYGTAAGLFPPEDRVAAKTGTAQTSNSNVNQQTDDWMIAFAPANAPRFAVAVILPNQALSGTGAAVAGPVMRCMVLGAMAVSKGQPAQGTPSTCP
jgi:peptidoglycan glycosyltransferase